MPFIYEFPHWLVGVATVALFVSGSVLGLVGSRGVSRRRGLRALVDNGVIGWVFSAILGLYAIAISLMAVASWSTPPRPAGLLHARHRSAVLRREQRRAGVVRAGLPRSDGGARRPFNS